MCTWMYECLVSFMSGDGGSKLLPYYRTMQSLQEKSRKEKAVLSRASGYDSQEEGVDGSGLVQSKSESIVYRLKWRTGEPRLLFCSFINLLIELCTELQNHLTF